MWHLVKDRPSSPWAYVKDAGVKPLFDIFNIPELGILYAVQPERTVLERVGRFDRIAALAGKMSARMRDNGLGDWAGELRLLRITSEDSPRVLAVLNMAAGAEVRFTQLGELVPIVEIRDEDPSADQDPTILSRPMPG